MLTRGKVSRRTSRPRRTRPSRSPARAGRARRASDRGVAEGEAQRGEEVERDVLDGRGPEEDPVVDGERGHGRYGRHAEAEHREGGRATRGPALAAPPEADHAPGVEPAEHGDQGEAEGVRLPGAEDPAGGQLGQGVHGRSGREKKVFAIATGAQRRPARKGSISGFAVFAIP
ncbi:hypothetical protein GCM10020000_74230 [Streptomyces olivoverticillatus]